MEKSFKIYGIRYWIILLLILSFSHLYINDTESLLTVFLLFPKNIFHITITFSIIIVSLLFYIETILNYVNLENTIKVRLRERYLYFIIKKIIFSVLSVLFLLFVFLLLSNASMNKIIILLFSLFIQILIFVSFVFTLKKRAFQYILIGNFILNVTFRIILALFL